MKYQRILEAVMYQPWLIKPSTHASIFNLLMARVASEDPPKREGEDICGDKVELPSMEVIDGIAQIPIAGVIGRKLSLIEKGYGAVDVIDIARDIDYSEKRSDIRGIVLDVDSPGGMVNGTPELADRIARVEKPIMAFTAGMMDSAAYWLAASTNRIFATRSADVGSIGVYAPFLDSSKRYEEMGYAIDVIRSDKFKGMGFPGTSLTAEQREEMQRSIDSIANEFKEAVLSNRSVPMEAMQGQSFMATEAVKLGLVDELVSDISEVRSML